MTTNLTIGTLLGRAADRLTAVSDTPLLDAELLLAHALSCPRARLKSHPETPVGSAKAGRFLELIERRATGEPIAYIVGYRHFWTLQLAVTRDVLVPRPETELLVERALALHPAKTGRIVDLGTGSGAIALALASERPEWTVTATDASDAALAVAQANARALGLTRVEFVHGRWLEPLGKRRFDLIVSNPPYIGASEPEMASASLRHEPFHALSPGDDALADLHRIIESAPPHLEPGGWLLLEHGATQANEVARELVGRGFRHVRSHRDLGGHERMTEAQWAPPGTN